MARASKLGECCELLAKVVKAVSPLYHHPSATPKQKHLMETMIGAALWYLPTVPELWTSRVSVEAVRSYVPDSGETNPRLTADHEFPRKLAAQELLRMSHDGSGPSAPELQRLYLEKYGRFNYISPHENAILKPFQKAGAFFDAASAYRAAGIVLIEVSAEELAKIKARSHDAIAALLSRAGKLTETPATLGVARSLEKQTGPAPTTPRRPAPNDLSELYRRLISSRFDFIARGEHHLREVYEAVKAQFRMVCDDSVLCSEVCTQGNQTPEWQHRVRTALQALKSTSSVSKSPRHGYWLFT